MNAKFLDKGMELRRNLLSIGCSQSTAWLISIEAGGSQDIVDIEYLESLGIKEGLLAKSIKCVQRFYLDELGL